jgi:hypothetical protein
VTKYSYCLLGAVTAKIKINLSFDLTVIIPIGIRPKEYLAPMGMGGGRGGGG